MVSIIEVVVVVCSWSLEKEICVEGEGIFGVICGVVDLSEVDYVDVLFVVCIIVYV